jgi:Carboxypeptidase regulatory-like domain
MRNTLRITTCISLVTLGLAMPIWAQVGNSVVTGIVTDQTDARIPGVTVTATNKQTTVQTTAISNESGVYNMPNVLPGTYTLRASLPGFQAQVYENVNLGGNETRRFNFTLQVATAATSVEVSVDAQQLLTQTGGTVGDVLPEQAVRDLPLVGNDVLDLVNVLGGVQLAPQGTLSFGADVNQSGAASRWTTLAGVSATFTNTSVNGLTVTDSFYAGIGEPDNTSGILSVTRINPDLVGEVRLILTPVDAELGRGNGQIQVTTRSGTNKYSGSVRWDVRNPALNARTWAENSIADSARLRENCNFTERGDCTSPVNWYNQNEFTGSYGGPIIKNKTFFFALYDQQIHRARTPINNTVLTPCARNGIFRYYPDWVSGNVLTPTPGAPPPGGSIPGTTARPVVDVNGTPVRPSINRDGTPYTDNLRYVSVFGPINFANFPTSVAPDCSNIPLVNGTQAGASSSGTAWDPNRWNNDPSGFVAKVFNEMPSANNFEIGDGLNTAGNRYVRPRRGADGGSVFGTGTPGDNTNRKQINVKIDHNFTASHKLATQLSYERDDAQTNPPNYQQGWWGTTARRPLSLAANFSSTLSPSMVNEFRFGLRRTSNNLIEAFDSPDVRDAARGFFPVINGIPVQVDLPIVASPMMTTSSPSQSNITRTFTFSDTFSLSRGQHAFRFGGEFRANRAVVDGGYNVYNYPRLSPGSGTVPVRIPSCGANCDFNTLLDTNANYGNGNVNHFQDGNLSNIENLLLLKSGSVGNMRQFYWVQDVNRLNYFESYSTATTKQRIWLQHEAALFFQDDWKMTRNFTLNPGLRWEYYGPPWEGRGMLPTPVGSNLAGAFGISGDNWDDWWQSNPKTNGKPTAMEHVGPHSPNPDRSIYQKDKNNFGPVLGFSWQLPWFGQGKTVVRGGYSITFQGGGNFAALDGTAGEVPGSVYDQNNFLAAPNTYIRMADFGTNIKTMTTPATFNFRDYPYTTVVPLPPDPSNPAQAFKPMSPVGLRQRPIFGIPTEFYDDSYAAPYIQNFTLAVTRNVSRKITVDVRYVGTVARKLFSEQPVNSPNFLTNGLKEAFDLARAGQESPLLDALTSSVNGAFGGSGSRWLRNQTAGCPTFLFQSISMRDSLAIGHYADVADCLAYTNGSIVPAVPGEQGLVLHNSVNARFPTGVPDNFIIANPQFGNLNIVTNANKSNYHSLQGQLTLRPTAGFSYQGTFTWSRLLGSPSAANMFQFQGSGLVAYYSMDRRNEDYGLLGQHRTLDYRGHSTFTLPIGPNKLFFGNTSGWVGRVLEDWQLSTIFNISTGIPMTPVGRSGLYESRNSSNFAAFAFPTAIAPVDLTQAGVAMFGNFAGKGEVQWKEGAPTGTYFPGVTFARPPDPQCNGVSNVISPGDPGPSLQTQCRAMMSALAVVDANGNQTIVAQNVQPGTRGNLGVNTMEGPGWWALDGSLSKRFQITESKRVQIRFDATNILNHPQPCAPTLCPGDGRGTNLALNPFTFGPLGAFGSIANKSLSAPRQFQGTIRFDF